MGDFRTTLELKGTDVLNGLRQICELQSSDANLVADPVPSWICKAVYRGRNQVYIKPKQLPTRSPLKSSQKRLTEDDEMSVIGSDITIIHRRRDNKR